MAGSLGLGDVQDPHDVTDTKLLLAHREPEDFQTGFVGQGFEETGFSFQFWISVKQSFDIY
jgi:hypothetical protein